MRRWRIQGVEDELEIGTGRILVQVYAGLLNNDAVQVYAPASKPDAIDLKFELVDEDEGIPWLILYQNFFKGNLIKKGDIYSTNLYFCVEGLTYLIHDPPNGNGLNRIAAKSKVHQFR